MLIYLVLNSQHIPKLTDLHKISSFIAHRWKLLETVMSWLENETD
jgi:hypothetical protein